MKTIQDFTNDDLRKALPKILAIEDDYISSLALHTVMFWTLAHKTLPEHIFNDINSDIAAFIIRSEEKGIIPTRKPKNEIEPVILCKCAMCDVEQTFPIINPYSQIKQARQITNAGWIFRDGHTFHSIDCESQYIMEVTRGNIY